MDFPGDSDSKNSTCNVGDLDSILGMGRSPGRGHCNPLQYSCLENPHGQRCPAGYSPWGHREWDTTERLSPAQHYYKVGSAAPPVNPPTVIISSISINVRNLCHNAHQILCSCLRLPPPPPLLLAQLLLKLKLMATWLCWKPLAQICLRIY